MKKQIGMLLIISSFIMSCSLDRSNPLDPQGDATIVVPNEIRGLDLLVSPVTASPRWIQVNWNKDNAVDGYYIYRASSRHSLFVRIAEIDNNQTDSYRDHHNILSEREYWYQISSYIDYGDKGILEGNLSEMKGIRVH